MLYQYSEPMLCVQARIEFSCCDLSHFGLGNIVSHTVYISEEEDNTHNFPKAEFCPALSDWDSVSD